MGKSFSYLKFKARTVSGLSGKGKVKQDIPRFLMPDLLNPLNFQNKRFP